MLGNGPLGFTAIGMSVAVALASAPGASLSGGGTISGGAATGGTSVSGSAPGAHLSGNGTISGGAASGGTSIPGNAPGASLSGGGTVSGGAATVPSVLTGTVTVPASRTAAFAAAPRVVVFTANIRYSLRKAPGDKLWYVADVTKDLLDGATTIKSVVAIVAGVTVAQQPVIQGSTIQVMLAGGNTALPDNYCTLRVTCNDGEVFDRTIHFTLVDDKSWTFPKDPDDQRYYAFDFGADAAFMGTAPAAIGTPVAVGVSELAAAVQSNQVVAKIGGLDTAGANSCTLPVTLANGELLVRTIYFTEVDN